MGQMLGTPVIGAIVGLIVLQAMSTPASSNSNDALAWPDVIQATDFTDLSQKFCSASRDRDHVLVLPASLFVDAREIECEGTGTYKLYRVVPPDDEDDFEYYIDPPFGKVNRLGCDGKAGRGAAVIAVNCRPE
ncbi:MAG: hypothetical protein QNJ62_11210 [Methyloceanibacter sp.]|nr:hypothetical protein [Methyloceanibacter sp.]